MRKGIEEVVPWDAMHSRGSGPSRPVAQDSMHASGASDLSLRTIAGGSES